MADRDMTFTRGSVRSVKGRAVTELKEWTREHYDREPTEAEVKWARSFVQDLYDDPQTRNVRTPTFTEFRDAFDLPPPDGALERRGIERGSMYDPGSTPAGGGSQ